MKTKMIRRHIHSLQTNNPGEIVRLLDEAEKIAMPDEIYRLGADIIETVRANVPEDDKNSAAAAYIMRIAYILNKESRLLEAPPKQKKPPQPATERTT